jgi:hypothetical protein
MMLTCEQINPFEVGIHFIGLLFHEKSHFENKIRGSGLNVQRPTVVSFLWPLSFSFPKKSHLLPLHCSLLYLEEKETPGGKKG